MKNVLSRFSSALALTAPAVALFAADAEAAAYIKFDGVDGESAAPTFEKHIEVLSWSWGLSQTGSFSGGGGGGAGKVSLQDFHFTMKVNKSSPQLFLRCAQGTHFPSVTLKLTAQSPTGGDVQYYTVTLTDVMVTSVQGDRSAPAAGSVDDRPVERVSLNFAKIRFDYVAVSEPGVVVSSGDLAIEQPATP